MKFIIIGDIHIGKLKTYFIDNSEDLLDRYFDSLILYCKTNNINTVMQLGDIFDVNTPSQNDINYFTRLLHKLEDNGISLYAITGNHDYKYNSELKSTGIIEQLISLNKFKNIHIYSKPKLEYIDGFPFSFLPFPEYQAPENIKSICLLHIDINTYNHINCGVAIDIKNGIPIDNFRNDNLYFCGHLHAKQYNKSVPNIYYTGTPYQTSFSEIQKDGLPDIKSIKCVTLTKNERDFDYSVEDVYLPSSFRLTTLFINEERDFEKIDSFLLESDRLTLKLKDDIQVPMKIREDQRVYKIVGDTKAMSCLSSAGFESSFEEYTEDTLKEELIEYIDTKEYKDIDKGKLKGLLLDIWKEA